MNSGETVKCPWCEEVIILGQDVTSDFKFKLVPTWDHPKSGCCNLCEGVIVDASQMEDLGNGEMDDYFD